MFDKRLFSLAPGVGRLVAAKVLCQWVGLLANVVFVVTVVVMLSPALAVVESAFDPMFSMGDSGLISRLFIGFGYGGFSAETYVGCVLAIVVCAVLRFLMMRAAAYFGAEKAAQIVEHAEQIKAAGARYCDCPACAIVAQILEKKDALLAL